MMVLHAINCMCISQLSTCTKVSSNRLDMIAVSSGCSCCSLSLAQNLIRSRAHLSCSGEAAGLRVRPHLQMPTSSWGTERCACKVNEISMLTQGARTNMGICRCKWNEQERPMPHRSVKTSAINKSIFKGKYTGWQCQVQEQILKYK